MLKFEHDESNGGKLTVHLKGSLTKDNVVSIRKEIEKAFFEKSPNCVTIDLSDATSMDTAGVALLVILCRICKSRDINFRIVNPDDKVRKVIRLAQLEQLLLGNGDLNDQ